MIKKVVSFLYILLILAFIYIPIFLLIVYSFNEGKTIGVWEGFSFKWYEPLTFFPLTKHLPSSINFIAFSTCVFFIFNSNDILLIIFSMFLSFLFFIFQPNAATPSAFPLSCICFLTQIQPKNYCYLLQIAKYLLYYIPFRVLTQDPKRYIFSFFDFPSGNKL